MKGSRPILIEPPPVGKDKAAYLVVLEKTETGFSAYCPDVPGCIATGKTRKQVLRLFEEALEMHLEATGKEGMEVPKPVSAAGFVGVKRRRA